MIYRWPCVRLLSMTVYYIIRYSSYFQGYDGSSVQGRTPEELASQDDDDDYDVILCFNTMCVCNSY